MPQPTSPPAIPRDGSSRIPPAKRPTRRGRAGGAALGHGGGDLGVSSLRINSARWRRRCVLAGPAVARSASISESIRGSDSAS
jgi:hypothetical protein